MEKYNIIYKKLEEHKKNENQYIFKIAQQNSNNIQELTKLSYNIQNPQPLTNIFS